MPSRRALPPILIALLATSPTLAHAVEPAAPSSPGADAPGEDEASPEPDGGSQEEPSEPAESSPAVEGEPAEAPVASSEDDEPAPAKAPPPKVYDYDTPDLEREQRYPTEVSAGETTLRRARAGGLLVGIGLTAAVVAPVVVVRPRPAITIDQGDGTSLALAADSGSLIAGGVISVVGAVTGVLGGRLLSDLEVDRTRVARRRRGLHVVSGVAFGVASGLFAAAVVDLARGGALWGDVLDRDFDPADIPDGEEAGRRMTRGIAMLYAVPSVAGLGLGLRLGEAAQVRVVSTGAGVGVVGRF